MKVVGIKEVIFRLELRSDNCMSVFMTKNEVVFYKTEITAAFEELIRHPWFSGRRAAKQWQFFRHCFQTLLGKVDEDYPCTGTQAIQYKYEINDKLQRYYLAFGKPIRFVFRLVSERKQGPSLNEEPDYPSCNGYRLMISYNQKTPDEIQHRRMQLERTVADAIDAEFDSYRKLPEVETTALDELFDRSCSRYREIVNLLQKHNARGWVLNNEMNPSTKRLIDVKIRKMSDNNAEVATAEYWLLMWWSTNDQKYAHTYKEMNRQMYYLILRDGKWLVADNIWGKPRTSTPKRNIRDR